MADELGRIVAPHVSGGGQIFETDDGPRMRLSPKRSAEAFLRGALADIIENEFAGVPNARRDAFRAADRIVAVMMREPY